MRYRLLAILVFACVTATSLAAQTPKAPAKPSAPPTKASTPLRLADGHPDLQNLYDVATVTPLERPTETDSHLVLTKKEATTAEKYERQRETKNDAPLTDDRKAPPIGNKRVTPKTYLELIE